MANLTSVQEVEEVEQSSKPSSFSCGTTFRRLKYEQAVARILFEYYLHGVNKVRSTLIVLNHDAQVQVNLILENSLATAKEEGELGLNDFQKAIFLHQSEFFGEHVGRLYERQHGPFRATQDEIETWEEAMVWVYFKADTFDVSALEIGMKISTKLKWSRKQLKFAIFILGIVESLAILMHRKKRDSLLEALLFIVTFTKMDQAWFEDENMVDGLAYLNFISPSQWHFVSRQVDLLNVVKEISAEHNTWSSQDTAGFHRFSGLSRQWKDLPLPERSIGRVHDEPVDTDDESASSAEDSVVDEPKLNLKKRKFQDAQEEYFKALAEELTEPGDDQNQSKKRKSVLSAGAKYLRALEKRQVHLEKQLPGIDAQMNDKRIGDTGFFEEAIESMEYLLLRNKMEQGEVASEMDLL